MKRILFLGSIVVAGTLLVCGAMAVWMYESGLSNADGSATTSESCPPPRKLTPLPDADALAARMKRHQEVYRAVRDQALAAYAKQHPKPSPTDAEARSLLSLIAYLCIWDDYYGEGLWHQVSLHTDNILREGNKDPIWQVFYDVNDFSTSFYNFGESIEHSSRSDSSARELNQEMIDFGHLDYPALFRLRAYEIGAHDLALCSDSFYSGSEHFEPATLNRVGPMIDLEVAAYGEMIKAGFSHNFLFEKGCEMLDNVGGYDSLLKRTSMGLDHAFDAYDRDNPTSDALDAEFDVDEAWLARGHGYASSVTAEGWQVFRERLDEADKVLTGLHARFPNEGMIAGSMMRVVLGKEEPRDQMELWFKRGTDLDPANYRFYWLKLDYLLPRWYGSAEDLWSFGMECAQNKNEPKVPMLLLNAVHDSYESNPNVLTQPEVWGPLEKVYRTYLAQFPNSTRYRSLFAIEAVQGEHWDVANEQFKILGDDWDRREFEDLDYAAMKMQAAENAGK